MGINLRQRQSGESIRVRNASSIESLLVRFVERSGHPNKQMEFFCIVSLVRTHFPLPHNTNKGPKFKMLADRTMNRRRAATVRGGNGIGLLLFVLTIEAVLLSVLSAAFLPKQQLSRKLASSTFRTNIFESVEGTVAETESSATNPKVQSLKSNLIKLAERTNRGFTSSAADKREAKDIVESLQRLQTIPEPARTYYDSSAISSVGSGDDGSNSSLSGKWTLIYTDAPDITGLDTSRNPFSTAKLGRIGQECSPPYIKNVIEWVRPDWAKDLPFSGSDESRILQKVVTSGSATPSKPTFVELKVAGLELTAGGNDKASTKSSDVVETIQSQGLPAGILSINPVDLKGPLNPPFGRFEILYLDEEFRAIRTSQNFLAVNRRIIDEEDEWF